ncbi:hypothetical protein GCM10009639_61530 [Kitasatospora putterlickiae]|uniref:Uncharacterized protein n=1 Tax=Kitasatospora putterlickiae TaxID=221725 RepID=A0ABN1YHQ5_9ACTN
MSRSFSLRLRVTAVALTASACVLGGTVSAAQAAQTAPARAESVTATEMAKFMGSGTGASMGSAIESAANVAYVYAQAAGWQRSQCYLLGSEVRSTGTGWFTAVAQVFCQR